MVGDDGTTKDRSILYAIAAACILGIIIVGALVLRGAPSEGFSELYFEDPEGLPTVAEVGEPIDFAFVVVSHEERPTQYRYNVSYNKKTVLKGEFSLRPAKIEQNYIEGINKKTIKVRLIPNETSLRMMDKPADAESKMRYNTGLGTVYTYGTGPGKINVVTSPKGYSVILWGENNTTRQIDVDLPGTSAKILVPGMSRSSSQDFLVFDTNKRETFRTNYTTIDQVGDSTRLIPLDNGSLSSYGYTIKREIWNITNDQGNVDVLQRSITTNYRYEFKKVMVNVTSEDSVVLGAEESRTASIATGENEIPSEYEIHFWVIVRDRLDTKRLLSM
ncbi:MAG: hypothetical protein QUS08_01715 [Methanothrix sp.]|nr:hypothetical protein [Methanothrix sp.]